MSDSVQTHRRQPTRLPRPWDSPGKSTGVWCHKLILFVATRNFCLDVHLFKSSRKKTPWHFQLSVCDHWCLQIILYYLCSPGNLYFLASLNLKTLFPYSRHYIHSSHAPTSQLLSNSFLWMDENGSLLSVFQSRDFYRNCDMFLLKMLSVSKASICRVLVPLFWLFSRVPAIF